MSILAVGAPGGAASTVREVDASSNPEGLSARRVIVCVPRDNEEVEKSSCVDSVPSRLDVQSHDVIVPAGVALPLKLTFCPNVAGLGEIPLIVAVGGGSGSALTCRTTVSVSEPAALSTLYVIVCVPCARTAENEAAVDSVPEMLEVQR